MVALLEPPETSAPVTPSQVSSRRNQRSSIVGKLLLLAGSVAFAFVLAEGMLRLLVPVTDVPYYFFDPVVGPRRQPGTSGNYVSEPDVRGSYSFNAQGWNHPRDYEILKPAGTRRVCVVGDSFVEALQVSPEQALFSVAERTMSTADQPVEWYAFAISGWGTTQQLEVIRHYVMDYAPDRVVLLFVENDPWDSSPYLGTIEPQIATYYLDTADELVLLPPQYWERSWPKRLAMQSALVRYFALQKGWIHSAAAGQANDDGVQRRAAAFAESGHRVPGALDLDQSRRAARTWLLIEKTLAAARDVCRAGGAELMVAFRGNLDEIESLVTGDPYVAAPASVDPYCLGARRGEMGREQLAPMLSRLGIPYLDLTDALMAKVSETGRSHVFACDTHYNADAHQAVGQAMAAWVDSTWSERSETDDVAAGDAP